MDWKERYYEAELAFHKLKVLTKKVPAADWTPEYRELAEVIHTLGRDVFYVVERRVIGCGCTQKWIKTGQVPDGDPDVDWNRHYADCDYVEGN